MTNQALREQWETRVRYFRASGQSAVAWCAVHQPKPHQLSYWMKQYETPTKQPPSPTPITNPLVGRSGGRTYTPH